MKSIFSLLAPHLLDELDGILTTIAGSKEVLEVNFQDWVTGEDILRKNLSGYIE